MDVPGEIRLSALQEIRRNLRSGKGLAASLLFLLGGAMALLLYVFVVNAVNSGSGGDGSAERAMVSGSYRMALQAMYDSDTANYLLDAPTELWWLYKALLFFVPTLVMLMGYDQIAGDLQHKTLRYAAMRARRTSLAVGRALGNWVACAAMSLGLCLFGWVITMARGDASMVDTLLYGGRFWLASTVFAGAYVGITALFSTFFENPILALFTSMATGIGLWIIGAIGHIPRSWNGLPWLRYANPGEYDAWLLSPHPLTVVGGVLILGGFAAAGIAGSALYLRRRDI